ncbi:phosphoribosyltransferase [Pedobacter hiemivivus]|uniref:Phosphoribosyltransferase n=1 Tax=Pedobacter hiemivivus TaxID=2530454 RepID=A0A4U1GGB6_9SPHI|nr:phosphoribosyltransferase family protein [Pedobacter hiemivivus]TKC62050.1 phosphoribosyltransferase [Pedobacter hiemivivus]
MFSTGKYKLFEDRRDAGERLGEQLKAKYEGQNPLIIGIPRGGVEVGYYVAAALKAEFSLVVSRKLPLPGNQELGFGAVTEQSGVYVSGFGREMLDEGTIEDIIEEQFVEVKRRVDLYRNGLPLPEMKGRIVILVDDGIAMGVTLVPVIALCRNNGASKVIIAVPVSGLSYDIHLSRADAIEVLFQPEDFQGVGQAYRHFGEFTDNQVLRLLRLGFK